MKNDDDLQNAWILTYTGERFSCLDPAPESVNVGDIAHALSMICRFGGHTRVFYSVAEHSLNVMHALPNGSPPELRLCALMHDAAEAYLGDMVTPLKRCMPRYRQAEDAVWKAIASRFGLPSKLPPAVELADQQMLLAERDLLMHPDHGAWPGDGRITPGAVYVSNGTPSSVEFHFLDVHHRLVRELKTRSKQSI